MQLELCKVLQALDKVLLKLFCTLALQFWALVVYLSLKDMGLVESVVHGKVDLRNLVGVVVVL